MKSYKKALTTLNDLSTVINADREVTNILNSPITEHPSFSQQTNPKIFCILLDVEKNSPILQIQGTPQMLT